MRLKHHQVIKPVMRTMLAATLAIAVPLVWGAGVSFAKTETKAATYYEDSIGNLCVGLPTEGLFTDSCEWSGMTTRFTSQDNVGIGNEVLDNDTEGEKNVASGSQALYSNTTGSSNVATGRRALYENTTGEENTATGRVALYYNTTGNFNTASGSQALYENKTGSDNVASGEHALYANEGGSYNTAIGASAMRGAQGSGSSNVAIGDFAGNHLGNGSNNIDVSNTGEYSDEGTTRIGGEGTQKQTFIAGISQTPVVGCTVQVTPAGQLGCNSNAVSTAVATFASFTNVASGNCLNNTELAGQGQGTCSTSTPAWSSSALLAGPTPAGGATVTNLYADSNATVTGTDTVLVAVIDNSTGTTLLSCTVNSTTANHCSNSSGSGSAAAGDNIEVKVTASGASGDKKQWRVRFRY